ncbi:MAG: hypothetical protein HQM09_06600 [Candidatus Riflebacteria bacterium]|nr:hypothetical protein [Candidatus Riflebacteria bacterium]
MKETIKSVSNFCFVLGFVSIIGSIATWAYTKGSGKPEELAHAERFGIFVGIWAPTFFIISNRLKSYAAEMNS